MPAMLDQRAQVQLQTLPRLSDQLVCEMLAGFDHILVPEINNGQLVKIIRDVFLLNARPYNKIMGIPITKGELVDEIRKLL